MTGSEKLDFIELRREMREGFTKLEGLVNGVDHRVQSLEITRAGAKAAEEERAKLRKEAADTAGRARWRLDRVITYFFMLVGAIFTAAKLIQEAF